MWSGKQAGNWASKPTARSQGRNPSSLSQRAPHSQTGPAAQVPGSAPWTLSGWAPWAQAASWVRAVPSSTGWSRQGCSKGSCSFPCHEPGWRHAAPVHSKKGVSLAWMFSPLSHSIQFIPHSGTKHTQFLKNHLLTTGFCWLLCQIFEIRSTGLKRSSGLSLQKLNTRPFPDSVPIHSLSTTLLYSKTRFAWLPFISSTGWPKPSLLNRFCFAKPPWGSSANKSIGIAFWIQNQRADSGMVYVFCFNLSFGLD